LYYCLIYSSGMIASRIVNIWREQSEAYLGQWGVNTI